MTSIDHTAELGRLFGAPGALETAVSPDFDRCAELVHLLLDETAPEVRREPWESYATGLTLVVGGDSGLTLGLDFPAGEPSGPDGGWIRARPERGAEHWRVGRRDAVSIWLLLKGAARHPRRAGARLRAALGRTHAAVDSPCGGDRP